MKPPRAPTNSAREIAGTQRCENESASFAGLSASCWGENADGTRVTKEPVCVKGHDDNEIMQNFIDYIDGWIAYHKEMS